MTTYQLIVSMLIDSGAGLLEAIRDAENFVQDMELMKEQENMFAMKAGER